MSSSLPAAAELLILGIMLVGLVGVLLPVLPGLLLIGLAGLAWASLDGGGAARWTVVATMLVVLFAGTVAKYVLPARSARNTGAPRSTMLLGAVGAVVGFFVIPVVGLVVGGVGAVFLAELNRLGDAASAWRSTRAVLVGVGIGVLIELTAGLLAILVWVAGVLAT
ncbi:MAG: DUF456 domain-containing protein [Sporichthyaceae bacterium]